MTESTRIPNPCLAVGTERVVELDPEGREKVRVTMVGSASSHTKGNMACKRIVELVMAKDAFVPLSLSPPSPLTQLTIQTHQN